MAELLNVLSKEEFSIVVELRTLNGIVNDQNNRAKMSLLYHKYQEIYNRYSLFYEQTRNLEAIKRIIFIQWYGVSEPSILTGIGDLDIQFQRDNLKILKDLILVDAIDVEFRMMISHYYSVSDWYFDSYFDFSNLVVTTTEDNSDVNRYDFSNRGLMGDYWYSLMENRKL